MSSLTPYCSFKVINNNDILYLLSLISIKIIYIYIYIFFFFTIFLSLLFPFLFMFSLHHFYHSHFYHPVFFPFFFLSLSLSLFGSISWFMGCSARGSHNGIWLVLIRVVMVSGGFGWFSVDVAWFSLQ